MPFNEALFWFGIAALGVGPFFILDGGIKKTYGIGLTVIGVLACAYSEYRYYHPEALPPIPFWIIIWAITWVLLFYNIYLRRFLSKDDAEQLKQTITNLEREKRQYQNDLAMAEGKAESFRSALLVEKPKPPSKLVIHSANYRAVENAGEVYQVGEFLQQIISGDSLVFDVENHNFKIGDKNYVPHDPLPFKEKRLQVTFSYAGGTPETTERHEHGRLLLPEDSKIKWLWSELQKAERSQLPLTALQVESLRLSSELLDFLKRLGPSPTPKYTAAQINDMNSAQVKVLINDQDGDFFDACEYHFGNKYYFAQTSQGLENEITKRATRMLTWYRKLEAAYALEGLKGKMEGLRNRFVVRGVEAEALIAPIPYKDSEQHIRSIAAKLWELAFEVGERGNL